MSKMKSIIIGDDIILTAHAAPPPSDAEWNIYCEQVRTLVSRGVKFRNIVFADGAGPNATQRARATEAAGGTTSPVAVVSSSAMVRGVVMALRWIARVDIKSFSPHHVHDAFEHLHLTRTERESIIRTMAEFQQELGPLQSAAGLNPGAREQHHGSP